MTRRRHVAVVGPGDGADDALLSTAYDVGRQLAEAGAVVVTGGLGGVMAAACRGAKDAGGVTLGLLPGADAGAANSDAEVVVPTGMGEARDALVVAAADSVIAVGGSWGTLAEVALACRRGTPVYAIGGWSVVDAQGAAPHGGPVVVETVAEAVRRAL